MQEDTGVLPSEANEWFFSKFLWLAPPPPSETDFRVKQSTATS